jgi:hypothetical protein
MFILFDFGTAIGTGIGTISSSLGGQSLTQPPVDISILPKSQALKDAANNYTFGPQEVDQNALGGTSANFNYTSMFPQTPGDTSGFNANQTFQNMFNDPNITIQTGGQTPQQILDSTGQYGGKSLADYQNSLGLSSDTTPQSNLMTRFAGAAANPTTQPPTSSNSYPGTPGVPNLTQSIVELAAPLRAKGKKGINLQKLIASGGPALDRAIKIAQGDFSGMTMAEQYAARKALGENPQFFQGLLQQAGAGQLGTAFNNAAGYNQNLASASSDLSGLASASRNSNIDQNQNLYNTAQANTNQFQNFFGNNLSDFSGFNTGTNAADKLNASSAALQGQASANYGLGQGISAGALSDKDLFKNLLLGDRSSTNSLIDLANSGQLPPGITDLINQTVGGQYNQDINDITGGRINDQLNQQFAGERQSAARRGFGLSSSPVSNASENVNKERLRLQDQAQQRANTTRSSMTIQALQNAAQNALSGAGIKGASQNTLASQIAPLFNSATGGLNASTDAINAGTNAAQLQGQAGQLGLSAAAQKFAAQNAAANTLLSGQSQQQAALNSVAQNLMAGDQNSANMLQGVGNLSSAGIQNANQTGQLGLATQGQGFDQLGAILQALATSQNTKQSLKILQEVMAAGGGRNAAIGG